MGMKNILQNKGNTNPSAFPPLRATGLETIECHFVFGNPGEDSKCRSTPFKEVTTTVNKTAIREHKTEQCQCASITYHLAVGVNAYNLHIIVLRVLHCII